MVYKIKHGIGELKKEIWFEMAEGSGLGTRSRAHSLEHQSDQR
jgi:hypothetical protein